MGIHNMGVPDYPLLVSGGIFQPILHLFNPEHLAFPQILAEKQVKQDSENRNKIQGKQPGPYTFRIPALKKDNQNA